MNTCNDNFWFWFTRPFAEFLGGLSLTIVIIAIVFLFITIHARIYNIRNKK